MNHRATLFAVALPVIFLAAGFAQAATTIYNETFSNGSLGTPSSLNGSTPDETTGGNTWIATNWQENGSTATIVTSTSTGNGGQDQSAFLAFTPEAGKIYTLSATMTVPNGGISNGWVALGFAANSTTTGTSFWANGTAPWFIYRPDTNVDSFAESLSTAPNNDLGIATNSVDHGNFATSANFSIVLDTTASAWTAEWYINGGSPVRTETYGSNPTIGYVGFGRENGNTSAIDDFKLTAVPEPSTLALLGLAAGLALLPRRRA